MNERERALLRGVRSYGGPNGKVPNLLHTGYTNRSQ
jgi:hypothetical protein